MTPSVAAEVLKIMTLDCLELIGNLQTLGYNSKRYVQRLEALQIAIRSLTE